MPVKTGEAYYYEGNEPELAAVGNVAVATIGERLFLRGPLEENFGAAGVELTSCDLREIATSFANIPVRGARLPEAILQYSNR